MIKELIEFTVRNSPDQRYAVISRYLSITASAESEFLDAHNLIEYAVRHSELYCQLGCVHDVGGSIIIISFKESFITVMVV
ncbi:hypothetical protein FH968_10800 [Buttiauxella sp. B2]|uniref:hypothetical protein n=1 Tax=Buttiauxella sp. B2 TaxID=2587812 RepID=UPI00111EDE98|nr:hypothetical protein [Buttiauxella sp. B2]TNV20483.1 hypothetical protein FH968_10800 [Buttiauxella sp. B2]